MDVLGLKNLKGEHPDNHVALDVKSQRNFSAAFKNLVVHVFPRIFRDFYAQPNANWRRIEANRLILWTPFFFGIGAATTISNIVMLSNLQAVWAACAIGICLIFTLFLIGKGRKNDEISIWIIYFQMMLFICALGVIGAQNRLAAVNAPLLVNSLNSSNISGEIIGIDRSYNSNMRALIRIDSIGELKRKNLPKYARLSVQGLNYSNIGQQLQCTAFLAPPVGRVTPISFDFARKAWFMQIGAIGACKNFPIYKSVKSDNWVDQFWLDIAQMRAKAAFKLAEGKIGGGGGFLAAIATGDRSYISKEEVTALQSSGLSHIISVSGLHVGLLGGIIFLALRKILSAFFFIALRHDTKKISAIFSFVAVAFYAIFTGAEAPALRAMIMVGVMTIAILLNRPAINMRGIAIAALVLLALRPENSLDAGFLMSFLATMALVGLWENIDQRKILKPQNAFERAIFWLFGAMFTSFFAGIATVPISLLNFQSANTYGLLANVIAAPISDFLIAPTAILGIIFGDSAIGTFFLNISRFGLQSIIDIAGFFANLPHSTTLVGGFNNWHALICVLGIVWLCIFFSKLRYFGLVLIGISFVLWAVGPKPVAYFAEDMRAMAVVSRGNAKVCFVRGGQFAANRLVGTLPIAPQYKNSAIDEISHLFAKPCSIGGGDWDAHFISNDIQMKKLIRESQVAPNLININIRGVSYALDNKTAPHGAVLLQGNGELKLITKTPKTPWQNKNTSQLQLSSEP